MDPAQPLFENLNKEVRIDTSDAAFVDVIHSNAKPTIPFIGFGMMRPVGESTSCLGFSANFKLSLPKMSKSRGNAR